MGVGAKKEEVVGGKMLTIAADEHERLYIKLSLNTTNNARVYDVIIQIATTFFRITVRQF